MLPYSPLHHLLLADAGGALVMTSGNVSDEPIAYRDDDALARLGPIADAFLLHDRPIHTRTDDSVVRVVRGRRTVLRRSRGYVPARPRSRVGCARPGARRRRRAQEHVLRRQGPRAPGSATTSATCATPRRCARSARGSRTSSGCSRSCPRSSRTTCTPTTSRRRTRSSARASSPSASSTTTPTSPRAWPSTASPAARSGRSSTARATATTGRPGAARSSSATCAASSASRTCWPVRLPGGDRAAREPWRMACAWLVAAGAGETVPARAARGGRAASAGTRSRGWRRSGFAAPVTTSVGRLFDAVAALCGRAVDVDLRGPGGDRARGDRRPGGGRRVRRSAPASTRGELVLAVRDDAAAGVPAGDDRRALPPGARGRDGGARARRRPRRAGARPSSCSPAACSRTGCCWRDGRSALEARGLRVLVPERCRANDGGIAYGQVAVAAARGS